MTRIVLHSSIRAPVDRCFDLARDVEVHCANAAFTRERAVSPGRTSGLLELGDLVTFEGRHFGLRLRLTARITEMERPNFFVDEVVRSAFKSLRHVHEFRERSGVTEMTDTITWTAPLSLVGRAFDALILRRHMLWFLTRKQEAFKIVAEQEPA